MPKSETVNKRPLAARDGKVYLDGDLVADCCSFKLVFTPKVWEGKALSDPGTNRRWIGYDITGTITSWKTNNLYRGKIDNYIKTGATPEFTLQGINTDVNSEYYDANGEDTVTAAGCVFTGDIPLMDMDTNGDIITQNINFGAKKLV